MRVKTVATITVVCMQGLWSDTALSTCWHRYKKSLWGDEPAPYMPSVHK